MMSDRYKILGVIGGMGPAATALFYQYIVANTDAECDKEHIHVVIDSNPQIPDRTEAVKQGDEQLIDFVCDSGKKLIDMGAQVVAIPCNTIHSFIDQIQEKISVPIINMIDETAYYCKTQGYDKIGVFATQGTLESDIYKTALAKYGISAVYPSPKTQITVMSVIYDYIKAGRKMPRAFLDKAVNELEKMGSQAIVLGCTELPLAFEDVVCDLPVVDSLEILAKTAIEYAGYKLNTDK